MERLQLRSCCRRPRLSQNLGALPALVGEAALASDAQLGLCAVDQGLLPPATQQTWCGSSGRFRDGTVAVPCSSMGSKFHPAPQETVPPVSCTICARAAGRGGRSAAVHMGVVSGMSESGSL